MVLKPDRERVKLLLKDTITLLCKNGLEFKKSFSVDAVIGVTLDENEVFLVSMNEMVKSESFQAAIDSGGSENENAVSEKRPRRRKRKRVRVKKEDGVSVDEEFTASDSSGSDNDTQGEPPVKKSVASKEEAVSDEEESEDLVIIKEEIDTWSESLQQNPSASNVPGSSGMFTGNNSMLDSGGSVQDMNFSDMSFSQMSNSGDWSQAGSSRVQYRPVGNKNRQSFQSGSKSQQLSASGGADGSGDHTQGQGPQQIVKIPGTPYICYICGKQFDRKWNFKSHLNWHQGFYHYYCRFCDKGFMSKTTLKAHESTHTGQKEFKCDVCFKEFTYRAALRSHMKKEHGPEKNIEEQSEVF